MDLHCRVQVTQFRCFFLLRIHNVKQECRHDDVRDVKINQIRNMFEIQVIQVRRQLPLRPARL